MAQPRRWSRTQTHILVWAGEEMLSFDYDGTQINVPPRTVVATVGTGAPYRYAAAVTKSGRPIPGTLAVSDVFTTTSDGGYVKTFDVALLSEHLERDRQDLMKRGLAIVMNPEDVDPVMNELIPLWDASQDARARELVTGELERRKRLEAKGEPLTPGSSEHLVLWAFQHLAKSQAKQAPMLSTAELFAAAAGTYAPPAAPLASPAAPAVAARYVGPDDPTSLYKEALGLGIKLTKPELEGLLTGDEDSMKTVIEKIEARKEQPASA
jgi:hypothetical protein